MENVVKSAFGLLARLLKNGMLKIWTPGDKWLAGCEWEAEVELAWELDHVPL